MAAARRQTWAPTKAAVLSAKAPGQAKPRLRAAADAIDRMAALAPGSGRPQQVQTRGLLLLLVLVLVVVLLVVVLLLEVVLLVVVVVVCALWWWWW